MAQNGLFSGVWTNYTYWEAFFGGIRGIITSKAYNHYGPWVLGPDKPLKHLFTTSGDLKWAQNGLKLMVFSTLHLLGCYYGWLWLALGLQSLQLTKRIVLFQWVQAEKHRSDGVPHYRVELVQLGNLSPHCHCAFSRDIGVHRVHWQELNRGKIWISLTSI